MFTFNLLEWHESLASPSIQNKQVPYKRLCHIQCFYSLVYISPLNLLYSTLLFCILPYISYSTLLHATLLYSTLLYGSLHFILHSLYPLKWCFHNSKFETKPGNTHNPKPIAGVTLNHKCS